MDATHQEYGTGYLAQALQPHSGWCPQTVRALVAEITVINRAARFNEGLHVYYAQPGILQAIVDSLAALSGYAD